ncbi:MAG: hypothetical protein FD125_1698 [bacterium]|nr:MAG: hypothetical protein FD125_1698 [bacterium]
MRRWLTIALSGLVLSCQGPAAVMAREAVAPGTSRSGGSEPGRPGDDSRVNQEG